MLFFGKLFTFAGCFTPGIIVLVLVKKNLPNHFIFPDRNADKEKFCGGISLTLIFYGFCRLCIFVALYTSGKPILSVFILIHEMKLYPIREF